MRNCAANAGRDQTPAVDESALDVARRRVDVVGMDTPIARRDFLKGMTVAAAATLLDVGTARAASTGPTAKKLPRWRGFNLLEKFIAAMANAPFR